MALRSYSASVGKPATDFQTRSNSRQGIAFYRIRHAGKTARKPRRRSRPRAFIDYERPKGWTPENPAGGLGYQSRQSLARAVFNGSPAMTMGPAGSAWLAANRQRSVDDAATTQWKTVMSDYTKRAPSRPAKPSMTGECRRTTRATPIYWKHLHDAQRMDCPASRRRRYRASMPRSTAMSAAARAANCPRDRPHAEGPAAQECRDHQRPDDNPIADHATNFPDKDQAPRR